MKMNLVLLAAVLLLTASVPRVAAQAKMDAANPKAVAYKPGQVWTMNEGITVTVLGR